MSKDWHRNPFMFRAFKIGVGKLLDALEPSGEARSPLSSPDDGDLPAGLTDAWFATPEAWGRQTAGGVLSSLYYGVDDIRQLIAQNPKLAALKDHFEDVFYDMSRARRDLGIAQRDGPTIGQMMQKLEEEES
jgi:hypothetical protein